MSKLVGWVDQVLTHFYMGCGTGPGLPDSLGHSFLFLFQLDMLWMFLTDFTLF